MNWIIFYKKIKINNNKQIFLNNKINMIKFNQLINKINQLYLNKI